jgi:hypothetical protein
LRLLTGDDFGSLFTSVAATADRLELRDAYRSDIEDEVTRRYVAGEPDDLAWSQAWFDQIRRLTAAGKRFRRVRVVSVPLSDYQRCGVDRIAAHNIAAGEDIRYLDRAKAAGALGEGLPGFDFWLFDAGEVSARVARLHFDDSGALLGAEIITSPAMIGDVSAAFDRAFELASSRQDFAEACGLS